MHHVLPAITVLILLLVASCGVRGDEAAPLGSEWPSWGNDPGAMRYSPLDQINTENVSQLRLA
ncbi:MAG TPA: hypothetical protein VKZ59_02510, partial [Acidobacteriota bacterium]|nr:hypothetical protein [Acidobacteriota bacterium]